MEGINLAAAIAEELAGADHARDDLVEVIRIASLAADLAVSNEMLDRPDRRMILHIQVSLQKSLSEDRLFGGIAAAGGDL